MPDAILLDLQQRKILVDFIPIEVQEKIIVEYKKDQIQKDLDFKKARIVQLKVEIASLEAKKG